ncbi:MAG: phosphorylase family protein [Gammaproteobacteria bacterium]|jgi:adenosylhomocysteine nucleosidase
MNLKHLGIITALLPEARCFVKKPVISKPIKITKNISLIVSGIGQDRAAIAANNLIEFGADAILITGTCGALSPELEPGDIVMPKTILTESQSAYQVNLKWHEHVYSTLSGMPVTIHTKNLLSTNRIISFAYEKDTIYKSIGACAVDMESASVIKIATKNQIPVLVIRTVIDPSNFTVPDFVINNSDMYGDANIYSLINSCITNPAKLYQLFKLSIYYNLAMKNLILLNKIQDQLIII